jgi:hypothetical protein
MYLSITLFSSGIDHLLHTDMPNSEEYVKRGESTLITTTCRVFSLHHSATISYHFDKIFTPNALEMNLLSNDVKLHANDWIFLKLFGCWTWNWQYSWWNFKLNNRKHQIHPILFPHQSLYVIPNHLLIICQNLIIWKLLLSDQLEFWKAQPLKNGYGSPRTYDMQNSE